MIGILVCLNGVDLSKMKFYENLLIVCEVWLFLEILRWVEILKFIFLEKILVFEKGFRDKLEFFSEFLCYFYEKENIWLLGENKMKLVKLYFEF